jgi:hypothetical protein
MTAPRFGQVNLRDDKVHQFSQMNLTRSALVGNTATFSSIAKTFQVTDIINASHYLSIFDQYKIDLIEVWLRPSSSLGIATSTSLYTAIDYDDSNAPASEAFMLGYQNLTIGQENDGVYRRFVPHIAVAAYNGTVFTGFKNEKASWIDSTSAIPHYGFKAYLTAAPTAVTFDYYERITVSFRNTY